MLVLPAAVTGFIETLKGPAKDDKSAREKFLDIMSVEAERMRRLIEDLLSLTRIELNEHVPPQGHVALDSVVRQAAAALAPLAAQDRITVSVAGADLPDIVGDHDELVQLFQNLIANALKFRGEQPPEVHVSAKRQGDEWVFAVRDNGIGIDPKNAHRVFEIFSRLHTQAQYDGSGIGLAICKRIIDRHGGKIWVESQLGSGATFLFTIPDRS